jgi:hypothetical protein
VLFHLFRPLNWRTYVVVHTCSFAHLMSVHHYLMLLTAKCDSTLHSMFAFMVSIEVMTRAGEYMIDVTNIN